MRHALAEEAVPRKLGIGMDLGVVARQTGKVHNVGFGNGAPCGGDSVADRELFEVATARRVGLWHGDVPFVIEQLKRLTLTLVRWTPAARSCLTRAILAPIT